jgi:hypothetical protein
MVRLKTNESCRNTHNVRFDHNDLCGVVYKDGNKPSFYGQGCHLSGKIVSILPEDRWDRLREVDYRIVPNNALGSNVFKIFIEEVL